MSGPGLFWVGVGVTLIVGLACGLLVYAALLDGRDSRIGDSDQVTPGFEDAGWTFPPEALRMPLAAATTADEDGLPAPAVGT